MITAGVVHSLHLIAAALLEPGDVVAVEGPSYLYATRVFGDSGLRMVKLPVDRGGLIPELLPELIRKYRIRMVFTNPTFQNPTGTTLSTARRKALLSICEAHRIPIVEDDPYGLLSLAGGPPPLALKAMSGGDRFVIYLGTLSKIVTPGMRIGWIVAPEPVLAKLCDAKRRMGYSSSHAGERLAQLVLEELDWDAHLRHVREKLRARRDCMLAALERHVSDHPAAIRPKSPAGGFYV
jgi:DNA-binding transcriptional MocR family regulator